MWDTALVVRRRTCVTFARVCVPAPFAPSTTTFAASQHVRGQLEPSFENSVVGPDNAPSVGVAPDRTVSLAIEPSMRAGARGVDDVRLSLSVVFRASGRPTRSRSFELPAERVERVVAAAASMSHRPLRLIAVYARTRPAVGMIGAHLDPPGIVDSRYHSSASPANSPSAQALVFVLDGADPQPSPISCRR